MSADEWPTLGEELGRKALAKAEELLHRHIEGKLSAATLYLLADALYDTITGLAPWDDANAIYEIRQEMGRKLKERS